MFKRKSDPPQLRSVFQLNAPRFEELENARDEDYNGWGALLLEAAFGGIEFNDTVSYGREAVVVIEGTEFEVHLSFRGPDWVGFVNEARPLLDTPETRKALLALARRVRWTEGVVDVKWMDIESFEANGENENWADSPIA